MSTLFWKFLKHPRQVGACCPSSPALCREITSHIGVEKASLVAELGPGTGVITAEIYRKLRNGAKLAAVELDEHLADDIEARFSDITVFRGCASQLDTMLNSCDLPPADVVISGLPFAIFPEELQDKILNGVVRSLIPGGTFATFAYLQGCILPAGIRFRKKLESLFPEVTTSPVVWNNMPPAFVYRCRNSISAGERKS
ncbi:MAG: methyltransferase domain-containing protein [Lentisphaeria bacterium]|nr:methyltransferase domain-containing protein [Lentisphaeria bacterium]